MQPIICRVNPRLWWTVPVALIEAGFMFGAPLFARSDPPPNASIWLIALLTWPFGGFFLILTPFFYLNIVYAETIDEPFAPSWLLFGALCFVAVVISLLLYLWFARAFIAATPDELRIHSPFRAPQIIKWSDIEAAGADMWGNWVRASGRKIYWMRGLAPARRGELESLMQDAQK